MDQLILPGFRFYPTEEELIDFYLHKKLHCRTLPELDRVIPSIDIYDFEPSQLPGLAGQLCQGDTEQWFFFVAQQEHEARGGRRNRTTTTGYWKATGSPSCVYSSNNIKEIGVKKTMVFYKGKAPTGRKTKWKMNEYKAILHEDTKINNGVVNNSNDNALSSSSTFTTISKLRNELSLCRVYVTSGCPRAFDRRPGTTTTTTFNNVIPTSTNNSTQNDNTTINNTSEFDLVHVGQGNGSDLDRVIAGGGGAPATLEGSCNNYDDIEMAKSLDTTFIDWEQLGYLS